MKFISEKDVNGKTILLRADINSEVIKKKVLMSDRIKATAETIKSLKKRHAKIVVLAHQSRPRKSDFISLNQHAKLINKITKIKFVDDIYGYKAKKEIQSLKNGEALLLENVRFLKEEFMTGKTKFVDVLSSLCDVYVNDALSVSHRAQASVVSFPKYMESYAGPILEKELNGLKKIKLKNCVYILGGAKPDDNIHLIGKNKILTCGLFGPMCLVASGIKLGAEENYLKKNIKNYNKILKNLKIKLKKYEKYVELPVDFAVDEKGKRINLEIKKFPNNFETYDIGSETIKKYIREIKKAKSVYVKGPAGYYTKKNFLKGTSEILRAISESSAFSLLGGGDLDAAMKMSGISSKKFGYVSLSGGALLQFIAGKKLPGLAALGFYKK